MTQSLPNCPSLEQLKNQAKDIHKAQKSGDENVCAILKLLARFADKSNKDILAENTSLQEVQRALALSYGFNSWSTLRQHVSELRGTGAKKERDPATKFIDKMLMDAIVWGASDLYFEPNEHAYRVMYRTDGIVHEVSRPPVNLGQEIAEELKLRASLDAAKRDRPEFGRITVRISETKAIDFRVRTIPLSFGEKITLQLMETQHDFRSVDHIGYEPGQEQSLSAAYLRYSRLTGWYLHQWLAAVAESPRDSSGQRPDG